LQTNLRTMRRVRDRGAAAVSDWCSRPTSRLRILAISPRCARDPAVAAQDPQLFRARRPYVTGSATSEGAFENGGRSRGGEESDRTAALDFGSVTAPPMRKDSLRLESSTRRARWWRTQAVRRGVRVVDLQLTSRRRGEVRRQPVVGGRVSECSSGHAAPGIGSFSLLESPGATPFGLSGEEVRSAASSCRQDRTTERSAHAPRGAGGYWPTSCLTSTAR